MYKIRIVVCLCFADEKDKIVLFRLSYVYFTGNLYFNRCWSCQKEKPKYKCPQCNRKTCRYVLTLSLSGQQQEKFCMLSIAYKNDVCFLCGSLKLIFFPCKIAELSLLNPAESALIHSLFFEPGLLLKQHSKLNS